MSANKLASSAQGLPENWEFQALLKARPVAGDPDLGQAYMDMTVWP